LELALFDLDDTLLSGDSDYEWAQFLIERGVLERAEYEAKKRPLLPPVQAGALDHPRVPPIPARAARALPREKLDEWRGEFMRTRSRPSSAQRGWSSFGVTSVRGPLRDRHLHQRLHHRADRARIRR